MLRASAVLLALAALPPLIQSGTGEWKGKPTSYWLLALEDPDPKRYNPAVQAISGLGALPPDVIPGLQRLLHSTSWQVRHRALMVLGNLGRQARPAHGDVLAALRDEEIPVRRQAASALRRIPAESRTSRLGMVEALLHKDDYIRRELAAALGEQAEEAGDIAPELGGLAGHADPSVRWAAQQLLIKLGPEAALPVLVARLDAGEAVARQGAAQTIGAFGPRAAAAVPALVRMLDVPEHRLHAMQSLESIGAASQPAVPALIRILRESAPSSDVFLGAARALGRIGPEARAALPLLRETLASAKLSEATGRGRQAAAEALARILAPGDPGLAGYARRLARALDDRDPFTRAEAARALVDLGPAAAPAAGELRRTLRRDALPKIRYLAAEALGFITEDAKPTVEALRAALGDEDASVRRKAGEALRRHSPQGIRVQ